MPEKPIIQMPRKERQLARTYRLPREVIALLILMAVDNDTTQSTILKRAIQEYADRHGYKKEG